MRDARKERDLSQEEVSIKLRRPQTYVSKIERGERRMDVIEFLDLSKALELDPLKILQKVIQ
jgi:transcriptional regulator with XRE-family HTH domain